MFVTAVCILFLLNLTLFIKSNSSLWKRAIAWERGRAASAYERGQNKHGSAECHSVDCSGDSKVLTELGSNKIKVPQSKLYTLLSALEFLYGGQFTLSTQLMKPNYPVYTLAIAKFISNIFFTCKVVFSKVFLWIRRIY